MIPARIFNHAYGAVDAGNYEIQFNAGSLASGVHFYRIQAGSYAETRKLVLKIVT